MTDQSNNNDTAQTNSGKKWQDAEKAAWLTEQKIQRSYQDDVVARINQLADRFEVEQYGALSHDPERYPLYALKTRNWSAEKPAILITGGVHGYETSGVHGALAFLETKALEYASQFNILVAPCVSPWAYETINRWNPSTIDPNRSFHSQGTAEEANALMKLTAKIQPSFTAHFDLHETTDTDNTTFRPALEARDGIPQDVWNIPDGFYTVGNSENPQAEFQKAIIESVKKVTHIAPADENGKIIGEPQAQEGVINYTLKKLGLCASLSDANYVTTTEVYPDSPLVTAENCVNAQVAAVVGGLDYICQQIN